MFLVAGLGNPGEEYRNSRHNAGFMVAARLMKRGRFGRTRNRYAGRWAEGSLRGRPVAVLAPQTFMNLSGESVAAAVNKKHIPLENLIVVHDDLDFPFGVVRCRRGGGSGGHNGLASVISGLGSDDFIRVRVGIGRPDDPAVDPRDWVLSSFEVPEEELRAVIATAAECVEAIVTGGVEAAMNRYNR